MITKNFKNRLAMLLVNRDYGNTQTSNSYGALAAVDVSNVTRYLSTAGNVGFPSVSSEAVVLSATAEGISVGTGDSVETENYINLEATITSGLSLSLANYVYGFDNDGNIYREFTVTATNIGDASVTINEIGYKQRMASRTEPGAAGTYSSNAVFLIDRTKLSTPLTIAPGLSGVIVYRLTPVTNSTP